MDQAVGEPSVLRKEWTIEVGAEEVQPAYAFPARPAVVSVALDHAAERRRVRAEVGPSAVVLEAGQEPRAPAQVHFDRDVSDQPRAVLPNRLEVGEAQPLDPLRAELV